MRTEQTLQTVIDGLYQHCGDLYTACKQAMVSVQFVKNWCKDDEQVAEQIQEAQQVGFMALESVAIKRATLGTTKGVYYKGERIDEEVVHHDTLLIKILEANSAKYRKEESTTVFKGPVQINHMPRAETYADWLAMVQQTEQQQESGRADPMLPPPIEDAEYYDVPSDTVDMGAGWSI